MQQQALSACFKEVYNNGAKPARILLPVRNLQFWIESNVLLVLKDAPFDKRDAQLVPTAGSCADCPKRTGHNKLLFSDDLGKQGDRCADPNCYQAKLAAHVAKTVAAKPELVQISTAYGTQKEGSPVLPRNKYTAIRDDKPKSNDEAKRPEFKVCKFTTDAIVTEGSEIGTIHKVCANPACPVHHPKKANSASTNDAQFKAEQEKRRREEAIANATGLRVLSAIGAAVPVRLMKRDLLVCGRASGQPAGRKPRRDPCQAARHQEGQGERIHRQALRGLSSPRRRKHVGPRRGRGRRLAHSLARQRLARSARCRRVLQGGRGRNHGQGQAGIRREGKSESGEESRAQAARQSTGEDREKAAAA